VAVKTVANDIHRGDRNVSVIGLFKIER
jgi:hypothetical protein